MEQCFILRDLGSLNGVAVNNTRINRSKLKDGDVIQFAGAAQVAVNRKLKTVDASARYRFLQLPSKSSPAAIPETVVPVQDKDLEQSIPLMDVSAERITSAIPSKEVAQVTTVCGVDKSVIQSHLTCALCRYVMF